MSSTAHSLNNGLRAPRSVILYPFGLAVFPALFLAVSNRSENIRPGDVVLPTVVCLWLALVAWLATRWVSSDRHRRGLISLAVVAWFSFYGLLTSTLTALGPVSTLARDQYALPFSLVLLLLTCWTVLKLKGDLGGASQFLNMVSLLLFLFLPVTYLSASRTPAAVWEPSVPSPKLLPVTTSQRPDIYYIVLDAYTGSTSLAAIYGFDNSRFEADLRARGFYVPQASRSNYVTTFLALAAALNWQYLDWIPELLGESSRDRSLPYRMIEDSRTTRFLKALGYRVIFFPTAYGATAHNRFADQVIPSQAAGEPEVHTEFQSVWLASTALRPVLQLGCLIAGCPSNPFPFRPEPPELILWKFAQVAQLPKSSSDPKFVFIHLLVPHEPYVFRADCSSKSLYWPAQIDPAEDQSMRGAYVEQVRCVNRQVLWLVDQILEDSARPPVILLQADHGNGRFPHGRPPSLEDISADQLRERTDVFAAYHLPGVPAQLYDSITPVNVIPAVLRAYFGAPVPPLEDRTYYSSWQRPYDFTQVR